MVGAEFHLVKDYFVNQLDLWDAIGPYNKEFGESDHVDGNWDFRKFGNMRSVACREAAISHNHQIKSNQKVKDIQELFDKMAKSREKSNRE